MTIMSIRGVSLYVEVVGHGYPLVVMHGGPGLDHTTLLPLEPLADQFTLVFYDHRCNGRSEGAEVSTMTWDNLTADADALRQNLGFDKWVVLGHSFGGNVALEYALRYPQSLSHLLLMDTGGDARWAQHNAPELLSKRGYSPATVQAARRFYNGQLAPGEVFPTVLKFISAYMYHSSVLYRPSLLALAQRVGLGPPMKMRPEAQIFGAGQLSTGWTVMNRLSEIQAPTLVLAGRHDFLFPPEHQAILADRLPNAQLELFECSGHNPQVEQPAEVIEAIRRFLSGKERVPCASIRFKSFLAR
jgi:proline iminopeptidase